MTASKIMLTAMENTYAAASAATDGALDDHIKGLEQRKGRGSYVAGVTDKATLSEFFAAAAPSAVIVSHEDMEASWAGSTFSPCTYIRVDVPAEYTARLGVVSLQSLLSKILPGSTSQLSVRRSLHSHKLDGEEIPTMEIVLDGIESDLPETDHAFVIIGPGDSGPMVWTWHPGSPAAAPTAEMVKTLAGIQVKVSVI
jgi:hypothetical protein